MTERIGQLVIRAAPREHEPGDERRDTDQHHEGVVVDVAGLQADDVARDVEDARRDAVRPEAVDDEAVAALPEQLAEPDRRADEEDVVDLVEVPLVEQELVEQPAGRAPAAPGNVGPADVELLGDQQAEDHHHGRRQRDHRAAGCSMFSSTWLSAPNFSASRKNVVDALAGEQRQERPARGDRADREDAPAAPASPSGSRARAS